MAQAKLFFVLASAVENSGKAASQMTGQASGCCQPFEIRCLMYFSAGDQVTHRRPLLPF
jgi:hypothetical protein